MSFVSAVVKTAGLAICQTLKERDTKRAQKRAYKKTCKDAKGKYDPFWHKNYNKCLSKEKQKVQKRNALRVSFIENL